MLICISRLALRVENLKKKGAQIQLRRERISKAENPTCSSFSSLRLVSYIGLISRFFLFNGLNFKTVRLKSFKYRLVSSPRLTPSLSVSLLPLAKSIRYQQIVSDLTCFSNILFLSINGN